MAADPDPSGLPAWVTGAEARFLTGASAEQLRAEVVSGRLAMYRPFGPGDRVAFFRTKDLPVPGPPPIESTRDDDPGAHARIDRG